MLPWRRNFHSKRPSEEGGLSGAPQDLPLDEFMYYVMVCEVGPSTYPPKLHDGCHRKKACNAVFGHLP